jgi:hypothetical protein
VKVSRTSQKKIQLSPHIIFQVTRVTPLVFGFDFRHGGIHQLHGPVAARFA